MHLNAATKKIALITVLVTVLFAFSTMISFWWMGDHVGNQHECVAATLQGVACPDQVNTASLLMHLNPFRDVLIAGSSVLTLVLAILMLVIVAFHGALAGDGSQAYHERLHALSHARPPIRQALQRWLARLQLSPTSA